MSRNYNKFNQMMMTMLKEHKEVTEVAQMGVNKCKLKDIEIEKLVKENERISAIAQDRVQTCRLKDTRITRLLEFNDKLGDEIVKFKKEIEELKKKLKEKEDQEKSDTGGNSWMHYFVGSGGTLTGIRKLENVEEVDKEESETVQYTHEGKFKIKIIKYKYPLETGRVISSFNLWYQDRYRECVQFIHDKRGCGTFVRVLVGSQMYGVKAPSIVTGKRCLAEHICALYDIEY